MYIIIISKKKGGGVEGRPHIMPKYLLQLRKTLFFLIFCSSDISFGSGKASSTAKATWHLMPPLKSLSDTSSLKGSPPSIGARSQACGFEG